MTTVPSRPKIYHITHVSNLASIVRDGMLWSDAKRISLGLECEVVGLSDIKRRRLEQLPVSCHADTKVGEYVPFYFCPRSIMLYILHMGNHPGLSYRGGQGPIVHLEADLLTTVAWAEEQRRPWAFSQCNAGAYYADFFDSLGDLDKVNWSAVSATAWSSSDVKEGKQAEFLMYESFPWTLVERVGVLGAAVEEQVKGALQDGGYLPAVQIERTWYY